MHKRLLTFAALALVTLTVLGACGSDDEDEGAATPATRIPNVALGPTEEPEHEEAQGAEDAGRGGEEGAGDDATGGGAPAGGAPQAPVELDAVDIAWSTNELTVPVGGTINLVNKGEAPHNFAIEGYNDAAPVDIPVGGQPV